MGSKQAVRRERSTLVVNKSIDQFRQPIADALTGLLRPALASGETMPDVALLIVLANRTLDARLKAFLAANTASELEAADDAEPRERRDRLEAEVRSLCQTARAAVDSLYGTPGLAIYQLTSPAESGPAPLARYARNVVDSMRIPRPELKPKLATRGISFDASAFADEIGPLVDQLDVALADVARERAEAAQATIARSAALTANDQAFVALAGLVEAMARAAGQLDVADRIRPSRNEPGVLNDEPEGPVEDATDPAVTPQPNPVTDPGSPGADPFDS
jgi:hypothetical protein